MLPILNLLACFYFLAAPVFGQTPSDTVPSPSPASTPSITLTPVPLVSPTSTPTITPTPKTTLIISSLPGSARQCDSFEIRLVLSNALAQTDYYLKAFGGTGTNDYEIEVFYNNQWVNGGNGAWASMPKFTSGADGQINQPITIKARCDQSFGLYSVTARARAVSGTVNFDSAPSTIQIAALPSPTPTATRAPTSAPPTATPRPTTFTLPSSTPGPTSTPRPTLTPIPTLHLPTLVPDPPTPKAVETSSPLVPLPTADLSLSLGDSGDIIGLSDVVVPSPRPESAVSLPANFFPYALIGLGSLLLIVPLLLSLKKS